ncbi:MAG: response regulator [Arcobacteraceae bacterium]|nr:response regulator [Arcobacteraceae bacterium]
MNIDNLHKLQILTKNLSLLYVENSVFLQKQISRFLDKIFGKIYQAYDGEDGLEQFNEFMPDIVLTDLTMPNKDGVEMIVDIKNINPNAKIIVLSAPNDDLELLQTIDLDIIGFLLKPLDIDKLINTLLQASKREPTSEEIQCMQDLEQIYKQKAHISLHNYYKGIPIEYDGTIIKFNDDEFIVKIPNIQTIAINYEKNTTLKINSTNKYIQVNLIKIDKKNNLITLTQPKYINYSLRNFKNKRVLTDKSFKVGLHHHHKSIEVNALDITFISITMISHEKFIKLSVGDEINLTLVFKIKAKNSLVHQDIITKVFAKGKVIRIEPYLYDTKIIASMNIEKSSQSTLVKYLQQREIETIQELKRLAEK